MNRIALTLLTLALFGFGGAAIAANKPQAENTASPCGCPGTHTHISSTQSGLSDLEKAP